jgi:hypothetical protein
MKPQISPHLVLEAATAHVVGAGGGGQLSAHVSLVMQRTVAVCALQGTAAAAVGRLYAHFMHSM